MPGVVYPPPADLARYVDAGALTRETLPAALMKSFADNGPRMALLDADGGMTYAQLDNATDTVAASLIDMGLQPLERVMFQMANSSELIVSVVACLKAGLIPVCTLVSHREAEMGYLTGHAGASAIFVDGDHTGFDSIEFARKLRGACPTLRTIVAARGPDSAECPNLRQLMNASTALEAKERVKKTVDGLDPFQVVIFQLSGGTTGVPKIIPRMHNDYLYNMRAVFAWTQRTRDEVVFCAGPLIHNAGMVCHWGPALLNGSAVVTDRDLSVEGLRKTFLDHKPSWLFLMRPLLVRLKEALRQTPMDLSFVTGVINSSHAQYVAEELGIPGYHFFGMAEGLIMSTAPGFSQSAIFESIGMPVSSLDDVRLYRPGTEEPVADGEVGELVCKGPYTLHGYYDAAERNREAFTSDGLYRSGDLLSLRIFDGKPAYVFEGRLKDVINRGGEKINCDEVERALRASAAIVDVAIVAMPDDVYIERACAFVCVAAGHEAPTVKSLGAHLQQHGLAKYKWPERVEILASLPTTNSGKVSKPMLREKIKAMLLAEAHAAAGHP
jgi:2,3-dihydroxybenzoate-AMP ligase